jgi:hypothetical protein
MRMLLPKKKFTKRVSERERENNVIAEWSVSTNRNVQLMH